MNSKQFVFSFVLLEKVMAALKNLTFTLQSKTMDLEKVKMLKEKNIHK